MFVVEIKTVQLDSYSTGHEGRDVRTDGAFKVTLWGSALRLSAI
jgi:hypothetical protein